MKIFISGACGFVGSELALGLRAAGHDVAGCDNFSRPGSELNLPRLEAAGVKIWRGDVRFEKDLAEARSMDWVIDAAANPSVLAGVDGKTSSRELLEHNLWGTVNLLEVCKRENAGLILLSTSRVYSIESLCALPVRERNGAFVLEEHDSHSSPVGVTEEFSTSAPISIYGASKLASEQIALEYGAAFGFPVWVNRCGVMAGAGQFGKPDQGIFSFWIHSWAQKAPLKYIGFGGTGHQVRDCLHPEDLLQLILKQFNDEKTTGPRDYGTERDQRLKSGDFKDRDARRIFNVGGGVASAMSLKQLSAWCEKEFGPREVAVDLTPRAFDLPWVVLDSSRAENVWDWKPRRSVDQICAEIAQHARENPVWLAISRG
jgi:CDP-paratose 2-epimerase